MKFSIKDFFSKCHQIRRKLLLKKSLMETSSFVQCTSLCPEVLLWNGAQRNSAAQVSLGIFQKYQHNHIKGNHTE